MTEPKSDVLPLHHRSIIEQVVRFELTSPVWKTRALTTVLYLLMSFLLDSNQQLLSCKNSTLAIELRKGKWIYPALNRGLKLAKLLC